MERLFTIGGHGFDGQTFFGALHDAHVDVFLDVRRRRGMRGAAYSFANATRLTVELEKRGIAYRHLIDLAPLPETRALQNEADLAGKVAKRDRDVLTGTFIEGYSRQTLQPFDWQSLLVALDAFRRPALFCVERIPEACHRSLVARHLADRTGVPVTDLMP